MIKSYDLIKFMKSIFLNGYIPNAKIDIVNGEMSTVFKSTNPRLRGRLILPQTSLPDGIVGVTDFQTLLKLLSKLKDDDLKINFNYKNGNAWVENIKFKTGNKTFNISGAYEGLIEYDGKTSVAHEYAVVAKIDQTFITAIIKAYRRVFECSLGKINPTTLPVYFIARNPAEKKISIVLEGEETEIDCESNGLLEGDYYKFDAHIFATILHTHSFHFDECILCIGSTGLMRMKITKGNIICEYWLVYLRKGTDGNTLSLGIKY